MNSGTPVALLRRDGLILRFYPTISDFARDFGVTPDGAYKSLIEEVPTKSSTLREDFYLVSVKALLKIDSEPMVGKWLDLDGYIELSEKSRLNFEHEWFIAFVDEQSNLVKVFVNGRQTARTLLGISSKEYQQAVKNQIPIKGLLLYEIHKSNYHLVKVGFPIDYKFLRDEVYYIYKNKELVDVVIGLKGAKRRTGLRSVKGMIDYKEEVDGFFIERVTELNGQKVIGCKLYENFQFNDDGLIDYYKEKEKNKGDLDET